MSYDDEELERLKQRRLEEYREELARREEEKRAELENRKQLLLKSIMTLKARQRLSNLKMVRPELVESLELQLIQLAQSGKIQTPVSDETLKKLLSQLTSRSRRDIRIKF